MKKVHLAGVFAVLLNISPAFAQDAAVVNDVVKGFNLQELGVRFAINAISIIILVRLIYFNRHRNRDFVFTFILFNCVNFLICYLLSGANLEVGFAFGLFAIFSIMRYRTVTVPVKDMGYLFLSVAMGLVNSLATTQENYIILILSNVFVLLLALFLDSSTSSMPEESGKKNKTENTDKVVIPDNTRDIIYERIDLIKPEMREEMIKDLRNRTGLPIYQVDVTSIDLLQDVAMVKAHYYNDELQNKMNGKATMA